MRMSVWLIFLLLTLAAALVVVACGDDDDDSEADDDQTDDDQADDDDGDDDLDDDVGDDDTACWDLDEDGFDDEACGGLDCNDEDETIHPGAEEICADGIDQDCDDVEDDGCEWWDTQTVVDGYWALEDERHFSLSFLSDGTPVVAFYEASGKNLLAATPVPEDRGWVLVDVDTGDDVGQYVSVDVDGYDRIGIAYYDAASKDLKVAFRAVGGDWTTQAISTLGNIGRHAKLRFGPDNKAQIIAYKTMTWGIFYFRETGKGFNSQKIFGGNDFYFADDIGMNLDSSGNPGFIYYYYNAETYLEAIKYGYHNASEGWVDGQAYASDSSEQYLALAWDAADKMILFHMNNDETLIYVTADPGTGWQTQTLPDGGASFAPPIRARSGPDGKVWLAFINSLTDKPRMGAWDGLSWSFNDVETDTEICTDVVLAVGPDGYPGVVYLDPANSKLMYTKWMVVPEVD